MGTRDILWVVHGRNSFSWDGIVGGLTEGEEEAEATAGYDEAAETHCRSHSRRKNGESVHYESQERVIPSFQLAHTLKL